MTKRTTVQAKPAPTPPTHDYSMRLDEIKDEWCIYHHGDLVSVHDTYKETVAALADYRSGAAQPPTVLPNLIDATVETAPPQPKEPQRMMSKFANKPLADTFVAALHARHLTTRLYKGSHTNPSTRVRITTWNVIHDPLPDDITAPQAVATLPAPNTEKSLAMIGDGSPVW